MLNKLLLLALVFSLAFNLAFAGIWAYRTVERRRHMPPPPPPWGALKLMPEQQTKLRESWRQMGEKMAPLHAEAAKHRDALLELMAAENPDEKAVLAEQARVEQIEEQIRQLAMAQMLETRKILDPQQRAAWLEMMRARGERFGWGAHRGGPRVKDANGPGDGPRPGTRGLRRGPEELGPGEREK
jgi:Spy/CpxP family protein refolding chaperone